MATKKKRLKQRGRKVVSHTHPEYLVQTKLRVEVNTREGKAPGHFDCFNLKENTVVKISGINQIYKFNQKTITKTK